MGLIDADELFEMLEIKLFKMNIVPIRLVLKTIKQTQTVDAVPVVRCGECKHQKQKDYCHTVKWCSVWNSINGMGDDGFCNYGERKDGAD